VSSTNSEQSKLRINGLFYIDARLFGNRQDLIDKQSYEYAHIPFLFY